MVQFFLFIINLFFDVIVTLCFFISLFFPNVSKNISFNFGFTSFNEKLQQNLLWVILSGEVFGTLFFPSSQYHDILVIVFTISILWISIQGGLTGLQNIFCSKSFLLICFCINRHEYHLFVMVVACVLLFVTMVTIFFSEVVILPDCVNKHNVFDEGSFSVKVVKWLNLEVSPQFLKRFTILVEFTGKWFLKIFLISGVTLIFIFIVGIWKYLWIKTGVVAIMGWYSSILSFINTIARCDIQCFQVSKLHHLGCCQAMQAATALRRGIKIASMAYIGEKYFKKTWDAVDSEGAQTVHELANLSRDAATLAKKTAVSAATNLPKTPS